MIKRTIIIMSIGTTGGMTNIPPGGLPLPWQVSEVREIQPWVPMTLNQQSLTTLPRAPTPAVDLTFWLPERDRLALPQ
jgi:hypothetical protein